MTMTDTETRLAQLRRDWRQNPDRRPEIAAEAADVKALHLLVTELGATVLSVHTIEGSTT